jgi:hypothetical protein
MFGMRSAGAKSAYTQAHGAYSQATVVSVDNIQHQSRSNNGSTSTWYTADVTATLNTPVGGLSQTTVHVPHSVSLTAGQTVTAVVDPRDPGYAELPGQPNVGAKDWYFALGGAVLCAVLACYLGWRAIRTIRRRRRLGY